MISRRGFLGMLAGLAVEPVARKVFVLAPPRGWNLNSDNFYVPESNAGCITLEMLQNSYQRCLEELSRPSPDVFYFSSTQWSTYGGILRSAFPVVVQNLESE